MNLIITLNHSHILTTSERAFEEVKKSSQNVLMQQKCADSQGVKVDLGLAVTDKHMYAPIKS